MHLTNLGGYFLLILLALLAPSPIPIPLDGIIAGLIAARFNPVLVLVVAMVGDVIGTILIFKLGAKGGDWIEKYEKRKQRREYQLARNLFLRYGQYALLLSGVPFLGDALIFFAGVFKLEFKTFLPWFLAGKLLWYSFFAAAVAIPVHKFFRIKKL